MKKHIVCFGDSNTHGFCADPTDCFDGGNRFNEEERWTCRLQSLLGDGYLVVEEGLGGRTTCFEDPTEEGLQGLPYITPCLKSHEPVDLLIIMLGTNDCKDRFCVGAYEIGMAMARLVEKARCSPCWGEKEPNILVVAPPPIEEGMLKSAVAPIMGKHCVEKSRELAQWYEEQCKLLGAAFLDAGKVGCEFNLVDHMHLTRKGHAALAQALSEMVPKLLK